MACLAAIDYDPATAVSKDTATLIAMTAIDTTNLRATFTVPANGTVMVRLKGNTHGATTLPRILLGILDGSTVKGRMSPIGRWASSSAPIATTQCPQQAVFLVTGLTPGASLTWDAAYGVEIVVAATGLKYGGPDNATTNDNFGSFQFEIWETTNLLAGTMYDPSTAVTKSTSSLLAMTALDTTNLRLTFTGPVSGKVYWRIATMYHGSTTWVTPMLGVLDGSTVKARTAPSFAMPGSTLATSGAAMEASGVIAVTPGTVYNWDAAYGVEIVSGAGAGIKYGGPNNATTDDAFGGIAYEIWSA